MGLKDIEGLTGTYTFFQLKDQALKELSNFALFCFKPNYSKIFYVCFCYNLISIYIYIYTYFHTHTHIYMYVLIRYVQLNVHSNLCVCKYIYTRTHECTFLCRTCSQGCWTARWRYTECYRSTCALVFQWLRFRALVFCIPFRESKMLGNYCKCMLFFENHRKHMGKRLYIGISIISGGFNGKVMGKRNKTNRNM